MSETTEQRRERIRVWSDDQRLCRRCGYARINVRHEPDPDNAPEGRDYYDAIRDQMHTFVAESPRCPPPPRPSTMPGRPQSRRCRKGGE